MGLGMKDSFFQFSVRRLATIIPNMSSTTTTSPAATNPAPSFQFEWKANRNFCVTAKHFCDFDTTECDEARESGEEAFFAYSLKLNHHFGEANFKLIGYYKTLENAEKALIKTAGDTWSFLWDRSGKCVNGCY